MSDTKNETLMDGTAGYALTADRYTDWQNTTKLRECGFEIHVPATGAPVGVWSIEGSCDPVIKEELRTGVTGASSAAKKVPLTTNTVHGSALNNTGGTALDSYVALTQGVPRWMRLKYIRGNGGTSSSLPTVFFTGAGWV